MLNFYRKFLQGAAQALAPFTDALKGPGKFFTWSPVLDSAFTSAKALLSLFWSWSILALMLLSLYASDTHLGAVLQQLLDGSWAPLAFYSKKLSKQRGNTLPSTENS